MSVDGTPGLSRRRLLGGMSAGAVTLGAGLPATSLGSAHARDDRSPSRRFAAMATGAHPQAAPALTLRVVDPSAFHPVLSTRERVVSTSAGGVTIGTPSGMLVAPIDLPAGVTLREVRVTYQSPAGSGANLVRLFKKALAGAYQTLSEQNPLPQGVGWQEVSFSLDEVIDGASSYMIGYQVQEAGQFVCGAAIGYEEPPQPEPPVPPPGFVAITPTPRVLDTRLAGGKLAVGEERVVALGVPGSAAAAVINLTVTETEDFGYLSVFPAHIGWPGNSSINWSNSGQSLANTVVSAVDAGGQIRIRAGEARTHVVVDVLGYFT